MSVPETTTPAARQSAPVGTPGNRVARRHGAASRQVGAAGQTRRTLQRDLARREASLRISRRVSGPAGGVTRPPFADAPPQPAAPAAPFNEPVVLAPTPAPAPVAQPTPTQPRPAVAGIDLRGAPAGLDVPSFIASPLTRGPRRVAAPSQPARATPPAGRRVPAPQRPQRARQQPAQRRPVQQAQRPVAQASAAPQLRPMAVAAPAMAPRTSPLAAAASALAAAPARLPISLPARPRLTALPGGLVEAAPAGKRRISTAAVMLTAITIVILTFGAILGLQIRKTQVNEQMGSDLGAISALQQKVTATREQLNRESASANVDGAARKGGLFEPDLTDVRFTRVGNRAEAAERAKRLLSKAPVAPTAAELAAAQAKAKAAAAAAGASAATGTTDAATADASTTGQTTSGADASMTSVPGSTSTPQASGAATDTTGAGVTQ